MDVAEQSDLKAYADRLEFICRAQKAEIAKLRDEVERLRSTGGAHSVLKSIYLNGELPESLRAKAASAAIQHEVPKLMPERAPLELKAEPTISLLEQAERRMKKAEANAGRDIEVGPNGEVTFLPRPDERNGGDGQDDTSS